jgi:hypothetical protein
MKIIHLDGFTADEEEMYKRQIFDNLCEGIYQCLRAMEAWEIELEDPQNQVRRPLSSLCATLEHPLQQYTELFNLNWPALQDDLVYPPDFLPIFQSLWRDAGLQEAVARSNEAAIPEKCARRVCASRDRADAPNS